MRAFLQQLLKRYRDLSVIAELSERELADIGVSREQALHLAAMPRDVPGRITAMARIFGIAEEALQRDRAAWMEMLEVCDGCRELPACRRLLMLGDFATPEEAGFCPNRACFDRQAQPA